MTIQVTLLGELKHQPEPVLREIWHYLKFLTRQRELDTPMAGLVADFGMVAKARSCVEVSVSKPDGQRNMSVVEPVGICRIL